MSYEIIYSKDADKSLRGIPKKDAKRIVLKIEALAENPRPHGYKKLEPPYSHFFRFHVGNFRVIYQIQDDMLIVTIVDVPRRNESTYR